ncbi:proliferating cell nuclear antigen-like [Malus domestica]|uniref:proliferating cell nuclear antigen-like n=1 Tax=Malus domestica TaxID=3750 RepID=UPI003974C855
MLGTERFWDQQMDLFTIERGRMIAPEFHYEYDVVVGIPSGIFGSLIMNLSRFGMTVSALVTETQVTFTVGNVKIVLRKELEECIIGGVVGENPVSLVFHIHYSNTMLRSSFLSKRVWLLGQSNGSSVMLNCPVGSLGNLMFYVG